MAVDQETAHPEAAVPVEVVRPEVDRQEAVIITDGLRARHGKGIKLVKVQ